MQDSLQDVKFRRRNIDYLQELYPGAKAHSGIELLCTYSGMQHLNETHNTC